MSIGVGISFYWINKDSPYYYRKKLLLNKQAYILGVFATRGYTGNDLIYSNAYNRLVKLGYNGRK